MIRHRSRSTRASFAAALAAAAVFISVLAPSAARAQSLQISINAVFVASPHDSSGCQQINAVPPSYGCTVENGYSALPDGANISNDPEINFTQDSTGRCSVINSGYGPNGFGNPITGGADTVAGNPTGSVGYNVCNDSLFLCAQISLAPVTTNVALDSVEFEVFRFIDGANPLDPGSTPPLKTFFVPNPGTAVFNDGNVTCTGGSPGPDTCALPTLRTAYCVLWDGSQNIQGASGKINGQYGFRVTVQTNQVGQSGNITITQVVAYPASTTKDSNNIDVAAQDIKVNVTDVHVIKSSPTVVGQITGVSVEPYNFTYRLSKDAQMYITVLQSAPTLAQSGPPQPAWFNEVRKVVPGLARSGEGALATTSASPLVDGDSWDGRDDFGNILPPGGYLVVFQANDTNQFSPGTGIGTDNGLSDLSLPTTVQIQLDPLQITDIRVTPLLGGSTSLAVLTYQLTEPATLYIDIYPPGTQFCNDSSGNPALADVNNPVTDTAVGAPNAKNLSASSGGCNAGGAAAPISPLRSIQTQQTSRSTVISFWDGRDVNGNLMGDGDYVFVIYAALPSQAGVAYRQSSSLTDKRVWTSLAKLGFISVIRGLVGITQISPTSTIIGSSPAIAGLNPFTFRYQLTRDAIVSMKVFDSSGLNVIKTIVNQETRPGLFNNVETWSDGNDDNGLAVASGTYLVQLTATDASFPSNVSTTTAMFPVDLFRVTDVAVTPLLSGASDSVTLSYQLSQPMNIAWNIYPAGSVIVGSTATWPPCAGQNPPLSCTSPSVVSPNGIPVPPIVTFHHLSAGRLKITESWDGRDANGLFVPDGSYIYTLTAQSTVTPEGVLGTPPFYATDHVEGAVTVARGAIYFTSFNVTPDVPQLFNSSNTITLDPFTISYVLTRQSSVTIQILNTAIPPTVMRTVVSGSVRQNGLLLTDVWDGRDDNGNFLPFVSGGTPYLVRVVALDVAADLLNPSTAQQTVLYDPLRVYDLAVTPNTGGGAGAIIAYQVSEPMKVAVKIYQPGTAFDASGNPQPPESISLVRRIVGIRPSRSAIQETWDGRDFRQAQVPDGTYKFKIVASTDAAAIDSVTGNVLVPTELADDRLTDDIPVVTNGSEALSNPQGYVENNSFVYPNPVAGPSGTFCIATPYHARVLLKLYTISGQLILNQDFGDQPPTYLNAGSATSSACGGLSYVWNKVNQGGRPIARGLYYALIRIEETEGGANVIQVVKKVLVP
jgi:flagellar hook assembly protein FlgD